MLKLEEFLNDGFDYCLERSARDIEQNRKGNFTLTVTDKKGNPLVGKQIHLTHKTHDFDFGANFFMVDQYDTPEQNKTYIKKFKKVFNTAVLPLYWGGTEPEKGKLRYRADSPNDMFRRPPAERVLNLCKQHSLRPKGHPLFWHEYVPEWLPKDWSELLPLVEKRFKEIAALFGEIPVFDCVNEPMRIWNVYHRETPKGSKGFVYPPDGYIEQCFALAEKYFRSSELILNEATGPALQEWHGTYTGYYQLCKQLLEKGVRIDRIGLQCHIKNDPAFQNILDARRLYDIFDGYATLGKPLVLSEIGLPSEYEGENREDFQGKAAEMLYRTCFSHKALSGLFWWNLPDDGVFVTKRKAGGENLPSSALLGESFREKPAYKVIDRLINHEWRTDVTLVTDEKGQLSFRGFNGTYAIEGTDKTVHLSGDMEVAYEL